MLKGNILSLLKKRILMNKPVTLLCSQSGYSKLRVLNMMNSELLKSDHQNINARLYSAFLLIALLVVTGASSTLCSISTPASSGSIMMRPQYSQTIIFLRERISNCL
ncbi:hypothetical protein HMPREF1205_03998 [Bacteroides fragilis HMW 616]|nr:hypothetical protein HMPREF1205_03998 [Bacteroides fragilis HMW 616]